MAAAKARIAPVGSAPWISNERGQAAQFIDQEVEEFGFSARNELEWLNEHMAEVFSMNNVNIADVFKTPGKLRGKTPRTARKHNALAPPRQPLGDIFALHAQIAPPSAQKNNGFWEKVAHFQIAEDQENAPQEQRPTSRSKSPQRVGKPGNTDSGYHGMTEDEMDVDARTETATASSQQSEQNAQKVPLRENQARPQPVRFDTAEGGQTSDESFMSAKEDLTSRNASREQLREEPEAEAAAEAAEELEVEAQVDEDAPVAADVEMEEQEADEEMPHSPSDDASSPEKPLQRKSSFTFSALPAREPLKRSIGARNSQADLGRNSVLARSFGAKEEGQDKSEETKAHNKTATQLLHERLTMLGKTKEPRTSKSIAQSALQAAYPKLPAQEAEPSSSAPAPPGEDEAEEDDDDWIAPSKPAQPSQSNAAPQPVQNSSTPEGPPVRPGMHQKSISTTAIPSPARSAMPAGHQKALSVSNPSLTNAAGTIQSTTPVGSPMGKKHHDGPLSASKNKLWSALKSAKSIFASSASASAAAKLEAHNSPSVHRSPKRDFSDESKTAAVFNMPGAMYSQHQLPQSPTRPMSVISASPSRKTRNASENDKKREKELKAQQKAADELEKAREKERQKAAKQQEEKRKVDEAEAARKEKERQQAAQAAQAERPTSADREMPPPPPPPKSLLPPGKLRAPTRLGRPARPEPQSKPGPLNIRIASQSQRLRQQSTQASLSKSQHESSSSLAPPPPPKTGLRTASAQANARSSTAPPANARVRALEAAARKKDADEKAAAKKLEQKRELERKRAAKAEEERRAEEERKVEEARRAQEARLAAQRKAEQAAAEQKRREMQKLEQQRQQEEAQKARAAHELAEAIKRERAAQQPQQHARGDIGGGPLRHVAKNAISEQAGRPAVQTNPAKPAKRVFQGEEDEQPVRQAQPAPQRPGVQRGPPSYQQEGPKRRRTNEEEERDERHSVMAPPKRPSNMRKESTLNKFPHGYTHAPPPATHHTASMFKQTVNAQHQLQHAGEALPSHPSQTVKMSNARIPFAENANPPAHPAYQQHNYAGGSENAQPGAANSKFRTPARPQQAPKPAKSSPMYPNGDNIALPEIMTDSEDEDSEEDDATGGFRAPSWVASPALRDLLTQQQLVDPESVFGPIGELKMEEVFKGGKNPDRVKKFRDRGSSAAWVESGDAVTSAEKRRDMEMRERVVREGGWRYEPSG